jgi:acetyl-CoA acetyltransferase
MAARRIPIVVGVGDIKNKSLQIEDALEPMQLMLQATELAIKDTSLPHSASKQLQSNIDSISVVATWTWNYHDLPGLIGEKLGVQPKYALLSEHGGNSPAKLFDKAARRISLGETKVAVVTGGEALASCEWDFFPKWMMKVLIWMDSGCLCCGWENATSRVDTTE